MVQQAYIPVEVNFGPDGDAHLNKYVRDQLTSLMKSHKRLHEEKVVQWRDWYYGRPKEENRTFPWENASNLVIQVIGTHVDMLQARVLAAVFQTNPLYVLSLIGEWAQDEQGDEQRQILEEFLVYVGMDVRELDLYRIYSGVTQDTIRFGTCVAKLPWETDVETEVVSMAGLVSGSSDKVEKEVTRYDGPRPEKIPFECFGITPSADTLESADFKYHVRHLKKWQLEERRQRGLYNQSEIDKVINSGPDRYGVRVALKKEEQNEGRAQTGSSDVDAEWDVHECWFPFWHNNKKYRLIYTYHFKSDTKLKALFNFYPDNEEPFVCNRLGYDGDSFHGQGFCEMLHTYQEELSTIHNQDIDNSTLANTALMRIDPNSKLDANFSFFPMACLPLSKDEFETFQLGRDTTDSLSRQRLIIEMARERCGIAPATTGMGGGVTNPKKGVYSAMGTFSILQEGNTRTNLNITDFRYFHLALGRMLVKFYSHFGIGKRAKLFGNKAELLTKALENIKAGRMAMPVKAATASINKEIEKQNDMLMVGLVNQHYQQISQILQNLPAAPPHLQSYLSDITIGSHALMKHILRNFGHDDVSRLLPEPQYVKELQDAKQRAAAGAGAAGAGAGNPASTENPIQPVRDTEQGIVN